jgi:hypothetical protein
MANTPAFLLSVVVPCFNEEEVIGMTHARLVETLGKASEHGLEIVYVNDGSRDGTEEVLVSIAGKDERVKVVSLTRNFGHQPAVTAGLAHVRGDVVAIIDADLHDPPEVIPDMIKKWREGFDVVYGVRTKRKEGLLKRFSYAAFYKLYRVLADIDIPLDGVFTFSTTPLSLIFVAELLTATGVALAAITYLIARIGDFTIFGHSPEDVLGFTTLIITILFFSGVQLISVGILGEYLGRIYQESKMRPTYVVKELRDRHARDSTGIDIPVCTDSDQTHRSSTS